ncbi:hypothetical protein BH10PSE7_BH10PSE7_39370 [soil metagenome]
MFRKLVLATTAALALGTMGLMSAGSASAASAINPGSPLPVLADYQSSNIQQVATNRQKRLWKYNQRRHGNRFRHRNGRFNHFYGGYYYERPWWNLGNGVSITLGAPGFYAPRPVYYPRPVYRVSGDAHVRWCFNHYRTYNPNNNTFAAYDGYRRRCISPYGG